MSWLGRLRKSGWPLAVGFTVAVMLAEALPLVGGLGEQAWFDWGFLYVTSHFVLLPLAAAIHVLWNLGVLLFGKAQAARQRLTDAASIAVTVGYLLLLYLSPVFPLWGGLLWENLKGEVFSWRF